MKMLKLIVSVSRVKQCLFSILLYLDYIKYITFFLASDSLSINYLQKFINKTITIAINTPRTIISINFLIHKKLNTYVSKFLMSEPI